MTISNGYCDLERLKDAMDIDLGDTKDDEHLELAIETASRMIDDLCGRRFWQDSSVVAREYYPCEASDLYVDDISTSTGLIVKVDADDDGTFETTLTIDDDFKLLPLNADKGDPVKPWEVIRLLDGTIRAWSTLSSGRPYVQVTAKFGWSAVPDTVERGCVIQAKSIFKALDATFGSFQASVDGYIHNAPAIDPMTRMLLAGMVRRSEVDDG